MTLEKLCVMPDGQTETFSEGNFKTILKKLNPPLDENYENCIKISNEILSLLQTNSDNLSSIIGIHNSLNLLKIVFEFHTVKIRSPSTQSSIRDNGDDPFYIFVLMPILDDILSHFNIFIFNNILQSINDLDDAETSATSNNEITSIIHKSVRTILTFLKRMSLISINQITIIHLQTQLTKLEEIFCELLGNTKLELPLDVKCNLGLGLCYLYKISDGDEILNDKFFARVFSTDDDSNNAGSSRFTFLDNKEITAGQVNRIAIMFGLLGVVGIEDGDFERRMEAMANFILKVDHGTKEALNLGSARVLEIWIEKLSQSNVIPCPGLVAMFPDIEFFVFSYLPGHIDAVKSCCRNILKDLTRIYDRMQPPGSTDTTHISGLLQRIMVKPSHVKWIALSCVTSMTPKSICILQIEKQIPVVLLCSERTMKNSATEAYLSLMTHHFSEVSVDQWKLTWIEPLFATQIFSANETNWAQKRTIIGSILKNSQALLSQVILDYVVQKMNSTTLSVCAESSLLAVEAIKLASELQIDIKSLAGKDTEKDHFRGIVPRRMIHSWAWSSSIQIRLACFSLLVETKKTSEVVSSDDLESLKILLKYSISSQNPAFRQQFFSYYKKLLKRLRDSRNLLIRNRDAKNIKNYDAFFVWLWNFLAEDEGLFPGANFGRRCQSLEFLAELLSIFNLATLKIELPETPNYLRWLFDTYEYNKKLSFPILQKLYGSLLDHSDLGEKLLEMSFRLCESVHPPDSVTGIYLGLFLIRQKDGSCPWIPIDKLLWKTLLKLRSMYEEITASSLIQVASRTQMYGYFHFIRTIFGECKGVTWDSATYRPFAIELLKLCLDYNKILLPVLGNAAPEGFLPGLSDSTPENSQVVRSLNAQRLLVCSWRTMRDICLLLAELVTLLVIEEEAADFIWTYEDISVIGDHLLFLMKNVMHRGVFEQVYLGFKQLAYRLFKSKSRRLNELPEKWLNDALDDELISTKCITRRSAGLPFIFQALLSPVVSNDVFISKYIDRLFEQYEGANSSYVRIHCANVLRGLFKDANFCRVMMPFVPKGLQLAFKELKSPNWNECNAGLMLYGAIIRRTFGPKMDVMTAPTFFRRFPDMYAFLLDEVKICSSSVCQKTENLTIADDFTYQVLVLLSSFAVNGVVEYGRLKLSEFISYIHSCGSSPDFQVREIAAKSLIPFLVQPASRVNFILSIFNEYEKHIEKSSNEIHGDFVQILAVLRSISSSDVSMNILIEAFIKSFSIENSLWKTMCPTVYETLAEICIQFGQSVTPVYEILHRTYESIFEPITDRRLIPGLLNADEVLTNAEIIFGMFGLDDTSSLYGLIYTWVQTKNRYFLHQLFNILLHRKFLQEDNNMKSESELSVVFDCFLQRYLREKYDYSAQSNEEERFLEFLAKISPSFYIHWTELEENFEIFELLYEKLSLICQNDGGTVDCKKWALIALGNLVFQSEIKLSEIQKEKLCEILCTWCDPNCDMDLRFAVAKCIPCVPFPKLKNFSISGQCRLWYSILTLMQDDEVSVRNELNSKIIGQSYESHEEFCDRKSAEVILSIFLNSFTKKNIMEGLVVITGLILRDDFEIPLAETEDSEDEHVFERSEMNSFSESVLLVKILTEYLSTERELKSELTNHFHLTLMTPEQTELYEFISNRHLSSGKNIKSNPHHHHTLENLILNNSSSKINWKINFLDGFSEKYIIQNYTENLLLATLHDS